ncbi:MAG: HlyC/CorC family transporter [Synergistaceae bacterium]|nr:HlyC/CorC family transporter [Candidatus Equadaptatus faecalis]
MDTDLSGSLLLLFLLLVLSNFFSAAETSITASTRGKLLALADEYPERKKGLLWLSENISNAINITLIGNNLVNIAASSVAAALAIKLFGTVGAAWSVFVMTALIVVFCEVLPKNIAISEQDSVLMRSLPILLKLRILLWPMVFVIQSALSLVEKISGKKLSSYSGLASREELEHIVTEGSESGVLDEDESEMIHSIIDFEETKVSEVMVPRVDMEAIEIQSSIEEAVELSLKSGHSRIPVYEEDLDEIRGVLYAKDLLNLLAGGQKKTIAELMRKPMFVPETMKTDEALETMKKSKKHIAIVVDEYGGTAGIVTLEDLIEEIIGDIQDEYDRETPEIQQEGENCWLAQGQANLEDLSDAVDYPFCEEFDEVDTLAGMILELSGNFPSKGETISYKSWDFHVLDVQKHRVLEVRLKNFPDRDDKE